MLMPLLFTFASFLTFAHALEPGLEHSLALERAKQITDISYALQFTIPEDPKSKAEGDAVIRFSLTEKTPVIVLDYKGEPDSVKEVQVNGEKEKIEVDHQHLVLKNTKKGLNEIKVRYETLAPSLNRGADFLYTLFVPDRASQAFPCFDQPDLKARFTLKLTVPKEWMVIGNEKVKQSKEQGNVKTYDFNATPLLSTYLFAFAAGKFKSEKAVRDGREMNLYYRESDQKKVKANTKDIFDLHALALKKLEAYSGIKYPYSKFDFVLIPAFQFGGMEHPGAIFYKEPSLFLDETASTEDKLTRASTIAHETAHQWFGDLVTMRWFEDVWLKEVMANFFAAKIIDPVFPKFNHRLKFYLQHYPGAYAIDRSEGANAIHQDLNNLQDAGSLYGSIIYLKAPVVVGQLEKILGEKPFQLGIREYLKKFQFGNASFADLIGIFQKHSKVPLAEWSHGWVEEAGRPQVKVTAAGDSALQVDQLDPQNRGRKWIQKFQVFAGTGEKGKSLSVDLSKQSVLLSKAPKHEFLLPNSDGAGYGFFRLDPETQVWLLGHVNSIPDPLARAVAWTSLWDEFYETKANGDELEAASFQALDQEKDELIADYVLTTFARYYWRFLTPEQREKIGKKWEDALWSKLMSNTTKDMRAIYWATVVSLSTSKEALSRLEKVWSRSTRIKDLPFSELDEMKLTFQLALRSPERAEEILSFEENRLTDTDRKAEFHFVRPALSMDEKTRRDFFFALKDPSNRRKEPWVQEALQFLNHPLRKNTEFMVQPGLEWMQEIQRTGNIFFPQRWIEAILSGQTTPGAAKQIRKFLSDHPGYPEDLKKKILQSADMLFRSVEQGQAV